MKQRSARPSWFVHWHWFSRRERGLEGPLPSHSSALLRTREILSAFKDPTFFATVAPSRRYPEHFFQTALEVLQGHHPKLESAALQRLRRAGKLHF